MERQKNMKLVIQRKSDERRRKGRPRKTWLGNVIEDLKGIGIMNSSILK